MSVLTTVESLGTDVKGFFVKFIADVEKAKAIWQIISAQQTRALMIRLGGDAIKMVNDSASAISASGLNLSLDAITVADIKQLIADAKAGQPVIAADMKALGVVL
jgi:hypothetical protein